MWSRNLTSIAESMSMVTVFFVHAESNIGKDACICKHLEKIASLFVICYENGKDKKENVDRIELNNTQGAPNSKSLVQKVSKFEI